MRTVTSELLRIPGVGDSKRRQLLAAFGSLQGVRDATAASIAALPGFGLKTAERVLQALRDSSPTTVPAAEPAAEASVTTAALDPSPDLS
jgi:excinuclease ABC subunit C